MIAVTKKILFSTAKILLLCFLLSGCNNQAMESELPSKGSNEEWLQKVKKLAHNYFKARKTLQKAIDNPSKALATHENNHEILWPLGLALKDGDSTTIQALLELGVDPNESDSNGNPALFIPHTLEIAHVLKQHRALTIGKNYRNEALIHALMNDAFSYDVLVYYVVKREINIHEVTADWRTALHCLALNACHYGKKTTELINKAELLIRSDLSLNAKDDRGETALDFVYNLYGKYDAHSYIWQFATLLQKAGVRRTGHSLPVIKIVWDSSN